MIVLNQLVRHGNSRRALIHMPSFLINTKDDRLNSLKLAMEIMGIGCNGVDRSYDLLKV